MRELGTLNSPLKGNMGDCLLKVYRSGVLFCLMASYETENAVG